MVQLKEISNSKYLIKEKSLVCGLVGVDRPISALAQVQVIRNVQHLISIFPNDGQVNLSQIVFTWGGLIWTTDEFGLRSWTEPMTPTRAQVPIDDNFGPKGVSISALREREPDGVWKRQFEQMYIHGIQLQAYTYIHIHIHIQTYTHVHTQLS